MAGLETFRKEVRAWFEENCPIEMRRPATGDDDYCWGGRKWKFQSDAQRLWLERMAEKGWTVPEWPKEYGGGALSEEETKILRQGMRAMGCRSPLDSFGIWMLGPALLKYGNDIPITTSRSYVRPSILIEPKRNSPKSICTTPLLRSIRRLRETS